jgi:hypothetical protein
MEISTAVALALVLCIALWVPFFIMNIRRGKARGHTWFTLPPTGKWAPARFAAV